MVVAAAEAAVGLAIIIAVYPHARDIERGPGELAQIMTENLSSLADSDPAADWRGHQWVPRASFRAQDGGQRSDRAASPGGVRHGAMGGFAVLVGVRAVCRTIVAPWIRAGNFQVDFSFYLDQLSFVMLLVVTGVGLLIHIYSIGYMWEEGGYYRFFCLLELVHVFHADAGTRKELSTHVHRVGRRGSSVVSSDWVLVHEGFGCFRWEESIH